MFLQRNNVSLIQIGILRMLIFNAVLKTMVNLVLCANCFRPGLIEKRMIVLG